MKIGDFSRLSRVSVKALRYYERLGLLTPVRTDEFTGYRYYSADQLPRLRSILELKDLGFSLEEVSRLLDEDPSPTRLRELLEAKKEEARRRLEAEHARLNRLEGRLWRLDPIEDDAATEEETAGRGVELKKVEALEVASVREVLPTYEDVERLFDELEEYRERHGIRAGDILAVWYDEEYRERDVFCEAAFVTEGRLPEYGRVRAGELPAVEEMACMVHHGPLEALDRAYDALLTWISENDYRIVGPDREVYPHSKLERGDKHPTVEVQFPVEKLRL